MCPPRSQRELPFVQWPVCSEGLKSRNHKAVCLSSSFLPSPRSVGGRKSPKRPQWGEDREGVEGLSSQSLGSWAADG